MPADSEQTARLRELHDDYAWKVNAAVAEGREDLIRRFCREYVEEALRMLADQTAADVACGRERCAACTGLRVPPPSRRGRRLGLLGAAGALRWPRHR